MGWWVSGSTNAWKKKLKPNLCQASCERTTNSPGDQAPQCRRCSARTAPSANGIPRSASAELPRDSRKPRIAETSAAAVSAGRCSSGGAGFRLKLDLRDADLGHLGVSPELGYRAKMNRRLQGCKIKRIGSANPTPGGSASACHFPAKPALSNSPSPARAGPALLAAIALLLPCGFPPTLSRDEMPPPSLFIFL